MRQSVYKSMQCTQPPLSWKPGFSLIEVLIAMVILGLVVMSAVNLIGQSIMLTEKRKYNDYATIITQQKMEYISDLSFDEVHALADKNGKTFTTTISDTRDLVSEVLEVNQDNGTTLSGEKFSCTFFIKPREYQTAGDSTTDVIQYAIKVNATWTDNRNKAHTFSTVTFVTK